MGLKRPITPWPWQLTDLPPSISISVISPRAAVKPVMRSKTREALSHGSHFDVRWVSPVQDGGTVVTRAAVTVADARAVVLDLKMECDGRTAMIGTATIPLQS